jgi:hypothetical protein
VSDGDVAINILMRRVAMTAMISMKLTVSDALAACATIASLVGILYVVHLFMTLF